MGRIAKHLGSGLLWTLINLGVGLLQLWILLGSKIILRSSASIGNQIILDGPLLFFSSTLVAALAIDYFFSSGPAYARRIVGGLFVLYPAVILVVAVWLFTLCFGKTLSDIDIALVTKTQFAVVGMTILYATIVKAYEFTQR